jgi:hypothetical protein
MTFVNSPRRNKSPLQHAAAVPRVAISADHLLPSLFVDKAQLRRGIPPIIEFAQLGVGKSLDMTHKADQFRFNV